MVGGREGLLEHLAAARYSTKPAEGADAESATATVDLFDAEADIGKLGFVVTQVADAVLAYDISITLSTRSTKAMMRATKGAISHVAGLVSPPTLPSTLLASLACQAHRRPRWPPCTPLTRLRPAESLLPMADEGHHRRKSSD